MGVEAALPSAATGYEAGPEDGNGPDTVAKIPRVYIAQAKAISGSNELPFLAIFTRKQIVRFRPLRAPLRSSSRLSQHLRSRHFRTRSRRLERVESGRSRCGAFSKRDGLGLRIVVISWFNPTPQVVIVHISYQPTERWTVIQSAGWCPNGFARGCPTNPARKTLRYRDTARYPLCLRDPPLDPVAVA